MKHWQEVTIDEFSGPIELLWTMVREKKLAIVKLSLIKIIDQYINYIKQNQNLDIEIASEYLVIASQLIEMKSRHLLPSDTNDDDFDDNIDIIARLEEFDKIKKLTDYYYDQQGQYFTTFSKRKTKQSFSRQLVFENNELLVDPLDLDLEDLTNIFKSILVKSSYQHYYDDPDYDDNNYQTLTTDIISPQEISSLIIEKMKTNKAKQWTIYELILENLNIKNIISCFLAILDLVRYQILIINDINEEIYLMFRQEIIDDDSLIEKYLEVNKNE